MTFDEKKLIERLEIIEKRLDSIEGKNTPSLNKDFIFVDKKKEHNTLLEELLKSDFCHSKNGLTREEILDVFRTNGRPIVPVKIRDLLNKWVERKKIEMIKEYGNSKYFWIENGTKKSTK